MHYQDPEINNRIEHLFSSMTIPSRIATAETVAHDYVSGKVSGDDLKLAELLLKFLINDMEAEVRATISQQVKNYANLPKELALKLAHDIEIVATPILKYSMVFEDTDLLEILKCAAEAQQIAIAQRKILPRLLTNHIAQHGCQEAVKACLSNKNADIGGNGYEHIIIRYEDDPFMQELIVRRPNLPDTTVARLCEVISQDLKNILVETAEVPPEIAERISRITQEKIILDQISLRRSVYEKQKTAIRLEADGSLTATLILRALIHGDFTFFTAGLAQVSGISIKRVTALVSDRGFMGLKRLYEKADMPLYLFPAFKGAIEELQKIKKLNPRADTESKQQRIVNKIAFIYNYEENLSTERLMEKLLQEDK